MADHPHTIWLHVRRATQWKGSVQIKINSRINELAETDNGSASHENGGISLGICAAVALEF
jgi:hypothetical protein